MKLLTSALILKIVDPDKYFVVCTYACIEGLGGFIMQDNHVVCYESRKWKNHDKNYATHDLELAAIVGYITGLGYVKGVQHKPNVV
jgi:hypothetical protein